MDKEKIVLKFVEDNHKELAKLLIDKVKHAFKSEHFRKAVVEEINK